MVNLDVGYTVMESWDKDGAQFKSGGTVFAPTTKSSGNNEGAGTQTVISMNTTLVQIPYGFQLNTKGGVTDEGDKVDMMIDFEYSTVSQNDAQDYEKVEKKSVQRLMLPIGRTTFFGGIKMLDESRISPSGLPILRNTPVLNWFVSDEGTSINDKKLVLMVCPEIVDNSQDGTLDVENKINIPVPRDTQKKTLDDLEDEKRPFSGGLWNPLNWFAF